MSQIANITVYDGASTPVSHTLVAISVTRKGEKIIGLWREQITSLPTEAQVTAIETIEKLPTGVTVSTWETLVPVMEAVSGNNALGYTAAPRVAYVDRVVTTQYSSPRSTIASRRLVRQLNVNLLGNVSTSVTPVTTGPAPELFDQQVSVT